MQRPVAKNPSYSPWEQQHLAGCQSLPRSCRLSITSLRKEDGHFHLRPVKQASQPSPEDFRSLWLSPTDRPPPSVFRQAPRGLQRQNPPGTPSPVPGVLGGSPRDSTIWRWGGGMGTEWGPFQGKTPAVPRKEPAIRARR